MGNLMGMAFLLAACAVDKPNEPDMGGVGADGADDGGDGYPV